MTTTALPDDLNIDLTATTQVFDYRNYNNSIRSQINLTKNTFSFLRTGVKEVFTENLSITIQNDAFLIIKSGKCLMTETVSPQDKVYKSMLFFFTDDMLFNFLEKHRLATQNSPEQAQSYLVCEYDTFIQNFVQSLQSISILNKELQHNLLPLKFEEIMTYLVQKKGVAFLSAILANQDDKVAKFINVVENNKLKKLTLQELSFLCNMSVSTFKRAFLKQYDMPPIKWFQEKRLDHAAFLLSNQQKRPIELYEPAGYETLSNFIQAFKKKFGLTPKQYQLNRK